jgi:hypothetical protein
MNDPKLNVWPEYLDIRDTQLHDDMGGGGQRIYTTAGRGYEKRRYVRADVPLTRLEQLERFVDRIAEYFDYTHDDVDEVKILHELQGAATRLHNPDRATATSDCGKT